MEKNYKEMVQEIANEIKKLTPLAKQVKISTGGYCPYLCFIRIDALLEKDYPHNISDNSIYIDYEIDFNENKFEVFKVGHVYLSPKDLKTDKYKYLCMKSITNILVDKGGKKMRKTKHKDNKTTAKKMADYFNEVMKTVIEYTGGYPYKEGIEE